MPHRHHPQHHHHRQEPGDQLIRRAWFYDLRSALLGARGRRLRRGVADALELTAGDRVLDVGSGPGRMATVFADRVAPQGTVVGVDAAEEMVRRAAGRRSHPRIEFRLAQAQRLPFSAGEFDAVSCTLVLHHVAADDRADAVREMFRVLKPGGRLVIAEFDPVHRPLWQRLPGRTAHDHRSHDTLAEAAELAEAAGFVDLVPGPTAVRWCAQLVGRKPAAG